MYRIVEIGTNKVLAEVDSKSAALVIWETYHYNSDLHVRVEYHADWLRDPEGP